MVFLHFDCAALVTSAAFVIGEPFCSRSSYNAGIPSYLTFKPDIVKPPLLARAVSLNY